MENIRPRSPDEPGIDEVSTEFVSSMFSTTPPAREINWASLIAHRRRDRSPRSHKAHDPRSHDPPAANWQSHTWSPLPPEKSQPNELSTCVACHYDRGTCASPTGSSIETIAPSSQHWYPCQLLASQGDFFATWKPGNKRYSSP